MKNKNYRKKNYIRIVLKYSPNKFLLEKYVHFFMNILKTKI